MSSRADGRYQSLKSGKFVSSYYAKRNPRTTRKIENENPLTKLLREMRVVAKAQGYAVAVHGSQKRDLDLVAVPWVEEASSPAALVDALEANLDLKMIRGPVEKPYGRVGHILCGRKWREGEDHQPIDLSVVGRTDG